ncbi:uncharacterized protein [Ptychodera flava]|uniref:uncharacterized protein n=1 Tax=Ptychodera flava TaxID=63121 RepID=UPI003969E76C
MTSDLKTVLAQRIRQVEDTFNAGMFRELAQFYSEDCQIVVPDKGVIIGREALVQECVEGVKVAGPKAYRCDVREFHASPDGYMIYQILHVDQIKGDGSVVKSKNNLIVWKKVDDGDYKICVDMSN